MRAIIVGARGMVGMALQATAPESLELLALDREALDITDAARVRTVLDKHRPDVVINCAAYVAVDKAETEKEVAWGVNVTGPRNLAEGLQAFGGRLIHISTNYVFSGTASTPYLVDSEAAPINYYGISKRAGEVAVLEALGDRAAVFRTSWVYGIEGRSFFNNIMRSLREKQLARVVDDQIGTPTSAPAMARMLWRVATNPAVHGLLHWTDAGVASWYDFAVAIAEEASARGLVPSTVQVLPVGTSDYPTPAPRPIYGVLDKRSTIAALGEVPLHWRAELRKLLGEMVPKATV